MEKEMVKKIRKIRKRGKEMKSQMKKDEKKK